MKYESRKRKPLLKLLPRLLSQFLNDEDEYMIYSTYIKVWEIENRTENTFEIKLQYGDDLIADNAELNTLVREIKKISI